MERVIVSDSSLELNDELKNKVDIRFVPFTVGIDEKEYIDDGTVDIDNFLTEIIKSNTTPRSAAPFLQSFIDSYENAKEVFTVTISSKVSASYQNAIIAKGMFEEENKDTKIHVFDSKSAVCGETAVAMIIKKLIDANESFENIVERVSDFIENMSTFFVLDSLDTLIKNGRISKIKAMMINALNIKPVMTAIDGHIELYQKARGIKNAHKKLVSSIIETVRQKSETHKENLYISHCNAKSAAQNIKNMLESENIFKNIYITETKALSSMYANDGGIVVAF